MSIKFCFDHLGPNPQLGYPNLAQFNLHPDQFDTTWPCCTPLRLLMYFQRAGIDFQTYTVDTAPQGSWYPVAMSWHDHSLDYFSLMSAKTLCAIKDQRIKVLFYYHEGDDPQVIKDFMDQRIKQNNLPTDCYIFISANGRSRDIENFLYFADHEHFFQYVNRRQSPVEINQDPRPYQFTMLSRTHKWWRASVASDLWHRGLLDHSQWSYNTRCQINDDPADNPLRVYEVPGWKDRIDSFLRSGPFYWDGPDDSLHNDHRMINLDLYTKSYCHLVLETHLDADGSRGSFLTEKTYKCLKFGQPFVIIGTPGSLLALRQQGYRVFDSVIDNSYDDIIDNTERWLVIRQIISDLSKKDLHSIYSQCIPDLAHNQTHFLSNQKQDLLVLAQYLDSVG